MFLCRAHTKMSREIAWRRKCPEILSQRIAQVKESSFFVLQEPGPTAFIIKPNTDDIVGISKFKVCLGSRQSCSCPQFISKKEICIHIVPDDSEILYQQSLIEREVQELMARRQQRKEACRSVLPDAPFEDPLTIGGLPPRPISSTDVCPICQESLLSPSSPLTHCKLSCGNSIHVKCMKVLMDHQVGALGMTNVKCPLCRNDFGSFESLQLEFSTIVKAECVKLKAEQRKPRHLGFRCHECSMNPILGKCHTCTSCPLLHLCDSCFSKGAHAEHTFQHRNYRGGESHPSRRSVVPILPQGFISDLEARDITDEDYETLRILDSGPVQQTFIPLHIINSFPVFKLSSISLGNQLLPDGKCICCASAVRLGDMVRKIPCGHAFHKDCIDRWLLKQRTTCPSCGLAAYSSIGAENSESDIQPDDACYLANTYVLPQKKRRISKQQRKETEAMHRPNLLEIIGTRSSLSLESEGRLNDVLPQLKNLKLATRNRTPNATLTKSGATIAKPRLIENLFVFSSSSSLKHVTSGENLQSFSSSPIQKRRNVNLPSTRIPASQDSVNLDSLIHINGLQRK